MNRLYLVRHGIAVPHGSPDYPDDERPLTPQGERRMYKVAKGLRRLGLKLDKVVTSPLPRAFRTAEIVAEVLGLTDVLETDDALRAQNDAATIRNWLGDRQEDRLMIVGHNPSFQDLVGLLAGGEVRCTLRKGGVAAFARTPEGQWALDWLARPRLLRD